MWRLEARTKNEKMEGRKKAHGRVGLRQLRKVMICSNYQLNAQFFYFQQYICYTTLLNMFRAARCSKHVEERSVTYILLKIKELCIKLVI